MKVKLKEITDRTINDLLQKEIIMPSLYFETFDKKSKDLNINFEDVEIIKEMNTLITEEFEIIDKYMNKTIKTLNKASTLTKEAQEAISNQDEVVLSNLHIQMEILEKQLLLVQEEIYTDSFTKTYNKKWLYNNLLNKNTKLLNEGLMLFIKVDSFDYISSTHGNLIADNLLLFILNFIKTQLGNEGINFKVVRYFTNQFIFLLDENMKSSTIILHQIKNMIKDKTLKSKSGIIIQPKFLDVLLKFNKNDDFHDILELVQEKLLNNYI